MADPRQQALDYLLKDEGGYAERPEEGGGAVNRGITFDVFKAWRINHGKPVPTWADLKAMPVQETIEIYHDQFLDDIHFDALPIGINYCVIDAAVLGGVTGAIKALQRALGFKGKDVDGHFANVTRWAVTHRDVPFLINKLCDERLVEYSRFKTFKKVAVEKTGKTWGTIWTERIERVRKRALDMAKEVPVALMLPIVAPAKPLAPAVVVRSAIKIPASPSDYIEPPKGKQQGIVGLNLAVDELESYLNSLKFGGWKPSGITLHNTYQPHLDAWYATPGGIPQRLKNVWVRYKKLNWAGGPHFFIEADDDQRPLWIGNPLTLRGTHSPSFNKNMWGVEMVGDFGKYAFDPAVKKNTVAALAVMMKFLGLSPEKNLFFHKEDPKTHHDCPGKNVSKPDMVKLIRAAMA